MKISLAINSKEPVHEWLDKCLESAVGFDETVLYIDGEDGVCRDVVDGFNYAVRKTTGDWVCSFCDDDYFNEPNLSELIRRIRAGEYDDADVIHFKVFIVDGGTWGADRFTFDDLRVSNRIPHGSFFRRSVFDELGGYQVEGATDWDFWLRASKHGYRFKYFPKPVYYFRYGTHRSAWRAQVEKYGVQGIRDRIMENVANA